jgi:hypothetical protein
MCTIQGEGGGGASSHGEFWPKGFAAFPALVRHVLLAAATLERPRATRAVRRHPHCFTRDLVEIGLQGEGKEMLQRTGRKASL